MPERPEMNIDNAKTYRATIDTNKGRVVMDLMPSLAPVSVNHFVNLARQGYYDGLTWHRYVADFVIQGGDPTGSGSGGPGYQFDDEPVQGSYREGAVAMANAGPNTNGSQFFICNSDCQHKLAPSYNLFGYVVDGMDVVKQLRQGDKMEKIEIEER
ncbi:MAG TPA: peptidylprolyl isomerase [Candidatus Dormibacteraeota bacterium]